MSHVEFVLYAQGVNRRIDQEYQMEASFTASTINGCSMSKTRVRPEQIYRSAYRRRGMEKVELDRGTSPKKLKDLMAPLAEKARKRALEESDE